MLSYLYDFIKTIIENNTITIPIVLAVIGWLIAVLLQRKNIKNQLKNQIKYDIYKQITQLHQETQNSLNKLYTDSNLPFILMESIFIGVKVNLKTDQQALQEGWDIWKKHITTSFSDYFGFTDNYIKFLYLIEDWGGPLKRIKLAQDVFCKEISEKQRKIYHIITDWQTISTKRGYDWRKWNKKEIEEIGRGLAGEIFDIQCFLHDFMVLIHNELMAEYFKYTRETRKPEDKKYKVLTIKGFVTKDDIK